MMTDEIDFQAFYEGKFIHPKDFRYRGGGIFGKVYRALAMDYSRRRARFLERHLHGHDNEILDFGCGAGTKLLTEYGRVTGIDYSQSSLQVAAKIYSDVKQVDGNELPFESERFDYIIGIDVFGHIPVEQKDNILREIHRVLKPSGNVIFSSVETDGKDWLSKVIKKKPTLYHEIFIQKHGHFGYEYPSEVIERFRTNGFAVKDTKKIQGGLFADPLSYLVFFKDTEYAKEFPILYLLTAMARTAYALDNRIMRGREVFRGIICFILGLIDTVFAEHFLSIDHTRALAICAVKPENIVNVG